MEEQGCTTLHFLFEVVKGMQLICLHLSVSTTLARTDIIILIAWSTHIRSEAETPYLCGMDVSDVVKCELPRLRLALDHEGV